MNKIVYLDGRLADSMGRMEIILLANRLAELTRQPVDILTHGKSKYHGEHRYTGVPPIEEVKLKNV